MVKLIATLSVFAFTSYIVFVILANFSKRMKKFSEKNKEKEKIEKIGLLDIVYSYPNSPKTQLVKWVSCIIGFVFMQLLADKIVFSIIVAIFAYNLPKTLANRKYKKRAQLFGEQLVDAFGFLRNALQAGSSLAQALQVMVEQSEPPLSEEFNEVLKKNRLGISLNTALNELDKKMGNKDLHLAVIAMNVTHEYGGNLTEILKRITEVMRERARIQKKIESITAQGRLSGWVITFIPFFLIVVLNFMQPELFGLMFKTALGNIMLGFAVLLVVVGNIMIQKIVEINI